MGRSLPFAEATDTSTGGAARLPVSDAVFFGLFHSVFHPSAMRGFGPSLLLFLLCFVATIGKTKHLRVVVR